MSDHRIRFHPKLLFFSNFTAVSCSVSDLYCNLYRITHGARVVSNFYMMSIIELCTYMDNIRVQNL